MKFGTHFALKSKNKCLDLKNLVVDCPCGTDVKYEQFLWNNRYLISRYFQEKLIEVKRKNKQEEDNLKIFKNTSKL